MLSNLIHSITIYDKSLARQVAVQQSCAFLLYAENRSRQISALLLRCDAVLIAKWQLNLNKQQMFLIAGNISNQIIKSCTELAIDYAQIGAIPNLTKPGLMLFDMDSTAIEIECIDEMAKLAGVGDKVSFITELAMQGKLDFSQSLTRRVALLKGMDSRQFSQIALPLSSGMQELCTTLESFNWKMAIASGGFTLFADRLKAQLPLCYTKANQLEIKDDKLTGLLIGEIVDADAKAQVLAKLRAKYHLPAEQTIAVGDGANDLPMLNAAGLGIAYKAKAAVEKKAQIAIRHSDLSAILCILSVSIFFSSVGND